MDEPIALKVVDFRLGTSRHLQLETVRYPKLQREHNYQIYTKLRLFFTQYGSLGPASKFVIYHDMDVRFHFSFSLQSTQHRRYVR